MHRTIAQLSADVFCSCRLHRDTNSDRWSRSQPRWPLDHHHDPKKFIFCSKRPKINEKEAKDCTYFKFLTKWPATKLPGVDKRIKWSTRADRMRENATTQIASKRKIKDTLKRKNALSTREKHLRSRLLNAF